MDITAKSIYAASGFVTVLGAFTISQWATLIGIILAFATFFVNLWYKKKLLKDTKEYYD